MKFKIKEDELVKCTLEDTDTVVQIPEGVKTIGEYALAYNDCLVEVRMPDSIKDIKSFAFECCKNLRTVQLSKKLIKIDWCAFSRCTSLEKIELPRGLKEIGASAFSACKSLENIELPEGIGKISSEAFRDCTRLKNISIPDSIKENDWSGVFIGCPALADPNGFVIVGDCLIWYCGNEKEVKVPDGIARIGSSAFEDADIMHVILPDSVTVIERAAFRGSRLNSISLSARLEKIEGDSFSECKKLKNIEIPDSVKYIGDTAFRNCTGLSKITLPAALEKIECKVFENCSALKSIIIPDSVTELDITALLGCTNIKDIHIPNTILEKMHSKEKDALVTIPMVVAYLNKKPQSDQTRKLVESAINRKPTRVSVINFLLEKGSPEIVTFLQALKRSPEIEELDELISRSANNKDVLAALLDYKNKTFSVDQILASDDRRNEKELGLRERTMADWRKIFSVSVKNNTVCIGKYHGEDTQVFVPEEICGKKVTEIKEKTFESNYQITIVQIPDSVTNIGEKAFHNCTHLQEVSLPKGLTVIEKELFIGCKSLSKVKIPENVTIIRDWAFSHCDSLTEITIPKNVKEIGFAAFSDCNGLTDITIPKNVSLDSGMFFSGMTFDKCKRLERVKIEGGVRVGENAFADCESLKELIMSVSVEIDGNPFRGCISLADERGCIIVRDLFCDYCGESRDVVIPDGVSEIGKNAFFNNKHTNNSIETVLIPDSVKYIDDGAFDYINSLKKVTVMGMDLEYNYGNFNGCPDLTLCGKKGSTTEKLAVNKGIPFICLD